MNYLDTNVIVRLISNDVPELAQQAIAMVENSPDSIIILDAVITEVCFVLEYNNSYKFDRATIYDGLYAVIDAEKTIVGDNTHMALDYYLQYPELDYVDCLILAGSGRKASQIISFDKRLLKLAN